MDFGGPGGKLLPSLVGVVALMGSFPRVFLGMSFLYSDGGERIYGHRSFRMDREGFSLIPAIQQYFPINGPRGEIMTEIVTYWKYQLECIYKIKVWPPIPLHSCAQLVWHQFLLRVDCAYNLMSLDNHKLWEGERVLSLWP